MATFRLDWPVDLEGYRLEERGHAEARGKQASLLTREGVFIVRQGGKLENRDPFKISPLAWRELADCETADDAMKFVNRFGFLFRSSNRRGIGESVDDFLAAANHLNMFCDLISHKDWRLLEIIANKRDQEKAIPSGGFGRLGLAINYNEESATPEIYFRPGGLIQALHVQALLEAEGGQPYRKCRNPVCPEYFRYGPGTEHRSNARYCSTTCKDAHAYAKRKEARL